MPTITGNTFSDFPPEEITILAFCDSCGHQGAVDRAAFPADTPTLSPYGRFLTANGSPN
jgi:hypothetical protein